MAGKISEMTEETSIDRSADYLEVWDASASASRRANVNSLLGGITGAPVATTDTQTLTNKTLPSPTISSPTLSGTLTGTYTIGGTPTFPASVVTLTGSQTLTNKTLTSPTINTPTITNPTLTVDTISEFTSVNGVSIDGLSSKDGALNTNNSVPNNAWNNTGSFGSSWAWQSWTPTFTNLSGGTLNYAKYTQIGKTVFFRWKYTLGGAGVSGTITFSTPNTMNSDISATSEPINGTVSLFDTGTAYHPGIMRWATSTTINLWAINAAATYTTATGTSSTVPFTWANTDVITVSGSYEAA